MNDLLICRNSEGGTVAEVDLGETRLTPSQIIDRARGLGAELLWAHGSIPGLDGFVSKPGYAHLHAEQPMSGDPLPRIAPEVYAVLLGEAYAGMWGHKWVDRAQSLPTDGSVVLCLSEDDVPIGLCRVWPDQRLADQPGVVLERREARHSLRLLGAACAVPVPVPWTWTRGESRLRFSRPTGN